MSSAVTPETGRREGKTSMKWARCWLQRFGAVFHKRQLDAEFADELESHLQMHIEEGLRNGMTAAAARRHALLQLGGLEQTKETYRDRRGLPVLETLFKDMRFAVRMLRKYPLVTVVAILTLALGIGVNTAVFSWIQTIVMNPVPSVADPARLVTVLQSDRGNILVSRISYPDFQELAGMHDVFQGFVGTSPASVVLTVNGHSEWVDGRVA